MARGHARTWSKHNGEGPRSHLEQTHWVQQYDVSITGKALRRIVFCLCSLRIFEQLLVLSAGEFSSQRVEERRHGQVPSAPHREILHVPTPCGQLAVFSIHTSLPVPAEEHAPFHAKYKKEQEKKRALVRGVLRQAILQRLPCLDGFLHGGSLLILPTTTGHAWVGGVVVLRVMVSIHSCTVILEAALPDSTSRRP